jgi:ABC-type branched-subunit amino acid transport system substrate-binding protein
MNQQQMKRFAIFAPTTPYGEHATALFEDAVTERGGEVTVSETYDPTATDLLPFARALGRKDYENRKRELYDLRKEAEEKGGNPDRVVLPPQLDFQALFLPDNAVRVPLACAALAYEEFPMGDFRPTKDSPYIPLLGLSGWNNANLVTQGGPYARTGLFPDVWNVPVLSAEDTSWSLDAVGQAFVEAYRADTGRTPTPLEAIVSDTGRLVAAAARSDADSREAFRDAFFTLDVPDTVTGMTQVNPETHRTNPSIEIYTLTKDQIMPYDVFKTLPRENH